MFLLVHPLGSNGSVAVLLQEILLVLFCDSQENPDRKMVRLVEKYQISHMYLLSQLVPSFVLSNYLINCPCLAIYFYEFK